MTKGTRSQYNDFTTYLACNAFDIIDLEEACKHQTWIADSVILNHHQQHPSYPPATALFHDALDKFIRISHERLHSV